MSVPPDPANDQDVVYYDAHGQPFGPKPKPKLTLIEGAPENSQDGLAQTFAHRLADDARYVAGWGRWFRWQGHRWLADDTLATADDARAICREAAAACSEPRTAEWIASRNTIMAVEQLARSDRRLAATINQWDADIWALNTPGGLVDLRESKIRTQLPADHVTKSTAVAPAVSGASCPRWLQFLARVTGGQQDLVDFLQKVVGYCLSGDTGAHALFFAYGTGANGKSVFINTISGILGDYATSAPMEAFMASGNDRHPTELADLRGARLVTATETEEGRRWAEARIKQLTGGDPIKARFMRQDFFEYLPQFKLFIAGNHKPALRGVDEAMRRRLHLIPFTVTIPPAERDAGLTDALKAEWPAILAWALEGCAIYRDEGLCPPPIVKDATALYLEGEDEFALWFEDRCDLNPNSFVASSALFASWKGWADRAGAFVGSQKRFTQTMETHGYRYERRNQGRGFWGISLKSSDQPDHDA